MFENDFPALLSDIPDPPNDGKNNNDDLFQCYAARGVCKVICFHPNSKLTLPRMTLDDIAHVIRTWMDVFQDLRSKYRWVQIFENRGDVMGCSSKIVDSFNLLYLIFKVQIHIHIAKSGQQIFYLMRLVSNTRHKKIIS